MQQLAAVGHRLLALLLNVGAQLLAWRWASSCCHLSVRRPCQLKLKLPALFPFLPLPRQWPPLFAGQIGRSLSASFQFRVPTAPFHVLYPLYPLTLSLSTSTGCTRRFHRGDLAMAASSPSPWPARSRTTPSLPSLVSA